jgi:hypothetical protein
MKVHIIKRRPVIKLTIKDAEMLEARVASPGMLPMSRREKAQRHPELHAFRQGKLQSPFCRVEDKSVRKDTVVVVRQCKAPLEVIMTFARR